APCTRWSPRGTTRPSFADLLSGYRPLAFVVVRFAEERPLTWEEAGAFFTDSGTGCLMDEACVPLLEVRRAAGPHFWRLLYDLKSGVVDGGDGNLVLEEPSGANAVVFATQDSQYPCFLGRGREGRIVWLVMDCR